MSVELTTRYYTTADGRVVAEGDPTAAVLLYGIGTRVSDAEALRIGAMTPADIDDTVDPVLTAEALRAQAEADAAAAEAAKALALVPANKRLLAPENKGG